jgi:hypothetical protein
MDRALTERDHALHARANHLARQALPSKPHVRHLGQPPKDPGARQHWTHALITIAAYRDHDNITDPNRPLGTTELAASTTGAD